MLSRKRENASRGSTAREPRRSRHRTRDRKELLSPEQVLQRHRDLAAQHGHQTDRVVAEAREHQQRQGRGQSETQAEQQTPLHAYEPAQAARQAVTYARDHVFERSAVEDRRDILQAALNRGMGQTTIAQVRQEFERRVQTGEFIAVEHVGAGQQYTTAYFTCCGIIRTVRSSIRNSP
jgi:hypothetical protein